MTPDMTIKPRILLCHHEDGHVTHYVGGRRVSAAAFRKRFRELIEQGRLIPALPQSTGFGYRVVWEFK